VAYPAASDRHVTTAITETKDKVVALIRNDFHIAKGGLCAALGFGKSVALAII